MWAGEEKSAMLWLLHLRAIRLQASTQNVSAWTRANKRSTLEVPSIPVAAGLYNCQNLLGAFTVRKCFKTATCSKLPKLYMKKKTSKLRSVAKFRNFTNFRNFKHFIKLQKTLQPSFRMETCTVQSFIGKLRQNSEIQKIEHFKLQSLEEVAR